MIIANLNDYPRNNLLYGGRAGQKYGITINGEAWIVKFPRTTRDLAGKRLPSYTSSPVSEYLGAHIYQSLGIPAHETFLGYRDGKIVCACKDFAYPGKLLQTFQDIKNTMSDDEQGFDSVPSDGSTTMLGDVLSVIDLAPALKGVTGVKERFWDMFVVDAFIKNPDRNNGNWGLLLDLSTMQTQLAPVYDLGSSLFAKRSDSLAIERSEHKAAVEQDAFGTNVSCYRLMGEDGKSFAIHPFEYMAKLANPDLNAAIMRFCNNIDVDKVDALIDEIPEEAYGRIVLSNGVKQTHKKLLHTRLEEGFMPLYRKLRGNS